MVRLSRSPSPLSEGIGGWGRCARACGVGVVVRWGGRGPLSLSLSLSLSLQGGADDDDDDSERERFHRIFSLRQAGGAREEEEEEEEEVEEEEEEEGRLRETHLTRTISLTSERPSFNHVLCKIIQTREPFQWQMSPSCLSILAELVLLLRN